MDIDLIAIPQQVYSDLSYLKSLNQVTLEYLVGEVCRNIINDAVSIQYTDNLDIIGRLSTDLENEGVIMSNEKILKIVLALRTLAKTYYRVYVKMCNTPLPEGQTAEADHIAELNPRFVYQL
jgi:hypothetical protein